MKRKQSDEPPTGASLQVGPSGELVAPPTTDPAEDPLWTLWKALLRATTRGLGQRTLDPEQRKDVASDGLLGVLERRTKDSSYATTGVGGFAQRTSRNRVVTQLRAKRIRERDAPRIAYETETHRSSYGNPELELEGNELLAIVDRGVAMLPAELGQAWYKRKVEGRTVKEIAEQFGISESLASNRICRAAAFMIVYVEQQLNGESPETQS